MGDAGELTTRQGLSSLTSEFCVPVTVSDEDIYEAMKSIPGYLDITPGDFKELYQVAHRHAVNRLRHLLKARDIMTRKVFSVSPVTPLEEVAAIMAQNKISGVPVVDLNNKIAGVISERDFLAHMGSGKHKSFMGILAECLVTKGCAALSVKGRAAKDIMSSPAITVKDDTSLADIAAVFMEKNINRVPVTDAEGSMLGIISRADLVRASLLWREA
jgi:CBS domain-containing membrane protein